MKTRIMEMMTCIKELTSIEKIVEIYPLISKGIFLLEFSQDIFETIEVEILDTAGRPVYGKKLRNVLAKSTMEINISGNPRGIYMIIVQIDKIFTTKKVILE